MKKIILSFSLMIAGTMLTSAGTGIQENTDRLSDEEKIYGLSTVWKEADKNFVFFAAAALPQCSILQVFPFVPVRRVRERDEDGLPGRYVRRDGVRRRREPDGHDGFVGPQDDVRVRRLPEPDEGELLRRDDGAVRVRRGEPQRQGDGPSRPDRRDGVRQRREPVEQNVQGRFLRAIRVRREEPPDEYFNSLISLLIEVVKNISHSFKICKITVRDLLTYLIFYFQRKLYRIQRIQFQILLQ